MGGSLFRTTPIRRNRPFERRDKPQDHEMGGRTEQRVVDVGARKSEPLRMNSPKSLRREPPK